MKLLSIETVLSFLIWKRAGKEKTSLIKKGTLSIIVVGVVLKTLVVLEVATYKSAHISNQTQEFYCID